MSSHLAMQDIVDINSWCRQHGLLNLTRLEYLANLITWHEVYPASCNRGLLLISNVNNIGNHVTAASITNSLFPCPPNARWFLLIVGQVNIIISFVF